MNHRKICLVIGLTLFGIAVSQLVIANSNVPQDVLNLTPRNIYAGMLLVLASVTIAHNRD